MSITSDKVNDPVLLLGGSGSLGSETARTLRKMHPNLPLVIVGRDATKAETLAHELGNASAIQVDLDRVDLGLSADSAYGAVVACLKDPGFNSLKYAQAHGIPFISVSDSVVELGPPAVLYLHNPAKSAVLLLGHSLGGSSVLASLYFARDFKTIETIDLGLIVDPEDETGAMTLADMEVITRVAPYPLLMKNGKWHWAEQSEMARSFIGADEIEWQGQAAAFIDVLSLATATGAKSARFDIAMGPTASNRRGEGPSHEVVIEITGERNDGKTGRSRYLLVDKAGHVAMSARAIAVGVERLLGLAGGSPVAPGFYMPETLIDPAYMIERMKEFGTQIVLPNN